MLDAERALASIRCGGAHRPARAPPLPCCAYAEEPACLPTPHAAQEAARHEGRGRPRHEGRRRDRRHEPQRSGRRRDAGAPPVATRALHDDSAAPARWVERRLAPTIAHHARHRRAAHPQAAAARRLGAQGNVRGGCSDARCAPPARAGAARAPFSGEPAHCAGVGSRLCASFDRCAEWHAQHIVASACTVNHRRARREPDPTVGHAAHCVRRPAHRTARAARGLAAAPASLGTGGRRRE